MSNLAECMAELEDTYANKQVIVADQRQYDLLQVKIELLRDLRRLMLRRGYSVKYQAQCNAEEDQIHRDMAERFRR